jgi:hypothetical protein
MRIRGLLPPPRISIIRDRFAGDKLKFELIPRKKSGFYVVVISLLFEQ